MASHYFEHLKLNPPSEYLARHRELDASGQRKSA